jgi:hypothetical protein
MRETARTGFLIRGTKEKSEGDVFHGHHLHQIHLRTELRLAFPCFILREQFGNRYTSTVWLFWNIIDVIDNFFPLFPYLLLYRTEEDTGSSPARSTYKLPGVGIVSIDTGYAGTCPSYPGVQAMPQGVIDTWGKYSIVVIHPMFTYGLHTLYI